MTEADSRGGTAPVWPALVTVVGLGSLPYVSLLAANVGEHLDVERVLTWWLITLAVGLTLVGLAAGIDRGTGRWFGALVGVATYLFFNYPAITGLREAMAVPIADVAWWALVSAAVIAIAFPLIRIPVGQQFLALLAPALLLVALVRLITASPVTGTHERTLPAGLGPSMHHTPNIYWFVLDGQAGPTFLRDRIGLDPDPFLDSLRGRGFHVQTDARANYPLTHLSVGSTLDMEYLYEGVREPAPGPYFQRLQGHNRTVDILLAHEYGYVHVYPGLWPHSRCSGREDVCFGDHGSISDTEWALASATPLVEVLVDEGTIASIARANDPLHVIGDVLSSAPPTPYFALIHLLNPHPPYLRDGGCRIRDVPLDLRLWGHGAEYREAVTCLFGRLEASVDRILEAADDPVIIIQGDHGPRLGLGPSTSGEVLLDDEMYFSSLSAIRLPSRCDDLEIPADLTHVNTFRVVFACLGDEPPALLPDRVFPILRHY